MSIDSKPAIALFDDEDGGTWVDLGSEEETPEKGDDSESEHNENLAEVIPEDELKAIASQLLLEIEEDERSRQEWLTMREKAVGLLGIKINPPRGDVAAGGAPFEGMSTYQDSALLEASIRFQANARGEMLPAEGPVKVQNDGDSTAENNAQAEALENACNKYLTVKATEYVPDSDRGFFQVGWSGIAFKKGYHCPIRRRPVIELVDAKDLIISNQATDIENACRVTHSIKMSKSVLIRMQIAGAYRDVELGKPTNVEATSLDKKIASTQGISKTSSFPESIDRTLYECYCDLDIAGYEHKVDGKPSGLPIPYKVTIDKFSRQVLEVRRNWKEGDEQCTKRRTFIAYPFIPAFGFYPLGLMHVLGNATNAITAAMRVLIDNGLFNNFPAFLYAKQGTGQDKNEFRAGPGQGIPVNVGVNGKISDAISPLPYKTIDASFASFIGSIQQNTQRLGGVGDVQVGEGNQQAPVGTTIALIEQAQKVMAAVHKRLHAAQAEEFRMLRELLQEDPEALWVDEQRPRNADIIIQALNNFELVPQADPNVASHMVRVSKAEAFKQLVLQSPELWDTRSAAAYYCDQIGIPEAKQFLLPPAPPQQNAAPDPNVIKAGAAMQAQQMKSQDAAADRQFKIVELAQRAQSEGVAHAQRMQEKKLDLIKETVIHPLSQALIADANEAVTGPQVPA